MDKNISKSTSQHLDEKEELIRRLIGNLDDIKALPEPKRRATDAQQPVEITFDEVDDRLTEFQEDPLVKEAFNKGINLRDYAAQIEKELAGVEENHVLDYVRQTMPLLALNSDITACIESLSGMEKVLKGYQDHLGTINQEIQVIQEQSRELNIKLVNRQSTQGALNELLEGVFVTPDLIKKIFEGEVNEFFVQHVAELDRKLAYLTTHLEKGALCFRESEREMERLTSKAAEKIREFMLKRIETLKASNTNIAIIQQNVFLKNKTLFWFLNDHMGDAGIEVHANYVATVSAYYYNSFDKYLKAITRIQMVIADKLDLMGVEENVKRGLFSGMRALKDKTNVYSLGDRIQVLTSVEAGIIIPHLSEQQGLKVPWEAIFKSFMRVLLDNACSEFMFCLEFFGRDKQLLPTDNPTFVFNDIFDATLKNVSSFIKQYVESTFDAVSLLVSIRLNSQAIRVLQKRRIPVLEGFLNGINILLWPRFQAIIDMHVESLKKATVKSLMPIKDLGPHYIMRRYAEFSASILTLNQGYEDALLLTSLTRLRTEVENLLVRMSYEFPDKKSRFIFQINNLDLVDAVLADNSASSFDHEKLYFQTTLNSKISEFVEEELDGHIGNLIKFVPTAEHTKDLSSLPVESFEKIATDFNANWKPSVHSINNSITQAFPNFQNGARILHVALTQYLLYYRRFLALWEKRMSKSRLQPVGIQTLMVEVKKFRSNFQ